MHIDQVVYIPLLSQMFEEALRTINFDTIYVSTVKFLHETRQYDQTNYIQQCNEVLLEYSLWFNQRIPLLQYRLVSRYLSLSETDSIIMKWGLEFESLHCFNFLYWNQDSVPELLLQCMKLEAQIHTVAFPESDTGLMPSPHTPSPMFQGPGSTRVIAAQLVTSQAGLTLGTLGPGKR